MMEDTESCPSRLSFRSADICKDVFEKLVENIIEEKKLDVEPTESTNPESKKTEEEFDQINDPQDNAEIEDDEPWETDPDLWDPKGLYGLRPQFLKSLKITPPLEKWVRVSNFDCDVAELKEVMNLAGNVLMCIVHCVIHKFAKILYTHPLEAVQAISMLNGQMYYGKPLKVVMDVSPTNGLILPKGLASIGLGLGLDGKPLRNVAAEYEKYLLQHNTFLNPEVFFITHYIDKETGHVLESEEKQEFDVLRKINDFIASTQFETLIPQDFNSIDGSCKDSPNSNISEENDMECKENGLHSLKENGVHPLKKNGVEGVRRRPRRNSNKPQKSTQANQVPANSLPMTQANQVRANSVPITHPNQVPVNSAPIARPNQVPANSVPIERPNQVRPNAVPIVHPNQVRPNAVPIVHPNQVRPNAVPIVYPNTVRPNAVPIVHPNQVPANSGQMAHSNQVRANAVPIVPPNTVRPNAVPIVHPNQVPSNSVPIAQANGPANSGPMAQANQVPANGPMAQANQVPANGPMAQANQVPANGPTAQPNQVPNQQSKSQFSPQTPNANSSPKLGLNPNAMPYRPSQGNVRPCPPGPRPNYPMPMRPGPYPGPFFFPPNNGPAFGPQMPVPFGPQMPVPFGPQMPVPFGPQMPPRFFFNGPNNVVPNAKPSNLVLEFTKLPLQTNFPHLCEKIASCGEVLIQYCSNPARAIATFKYPAHAEKCFQTFSNMKMDGNKINVKYL